MSQSGADMAAAPDGKVEEPPTGATAVGGATTTSTDAKLVDTVPLTDEQRAVLATMRSSLTEADVKAGLDTRMVRLCTGRWASGCCGVHHAARCARDPAPPRTVR